MLYAANHLTLLATDSTQLAQITISDSSQPQTSTNNLLVYQPRFDDHHNSNLAGVFINLEGVFPPFTSYNVTHQSVKFSQTKKMGSGMEEHWLELLTLATIFTFSVCPVNFYLWHCYPAMPWVQYRLFPDISQFFSCLLPFKISPFLMNCLNCELAEMQLVMGSNVV